MMIEVPTVMHFVCFYFLHFSLFDIVLFLDYGLLTGEEYNKLLAHAKNYLPFLKRVMMNTGRLGIQEEHLNKLRSLYEMVDGKRLAFVFHSTIFILLLAIWALNDNIVYYRITIVYSGRSVNIKEVTR